MPSNNTNKSIIPINVNADLLKERKAASFSVSEFTKWWYGGDEKLKFKWQLERIINDDMTEENSLVYYKSHEEIFEQALKQSIVLAKKLRELQREHNPGDSDIWPGLFLSPLTWCAMPAQNPFGVHASMVLRALRMQGTDDQWTEFGKRAENFELTFAYAQTELGHGSFVRGLETRADYDRKTAEFVLNTPTLTAYKWWPGGLGHCTNHSVVVAQLYIDGEAKGIQMFVVPIRDVETHMPLPGIDVGEIGQTMSHSGVNHGFLGLKDVRVPRKNMLMRNAQVLPDGTFVKGAVSQLAYLPMVSMRCMIVNDNTNLLAMAATIATRYAAVRRQSPINASDPEPQIMDHVTQQLKLFPEIATVVAYRMARNYLLSLFDKTAVEIGRGEYARLPEIHALSCALKSLVTYDSSCAIERLRLSCGGHGYLSSSNMGSLYAMATAACTFEGENTVLLLQVGRFLMKSWRAAIEGKPLTPTASYLSDAAKQKAFGQWTGSWENIVKALQYAAANKTRLAYENMSQRLKSGQTEAEAANNTGIELTKAAELHGRAFICATFVEQVTADDSAERSIALNCVLQHLLELYLVHTAHKCLNDILQCVSLSDADLRVLQTRLETALHKLRPDAVAICDGFDFHDRTLSSTLGSYDGNVYERLFDMAKKSPLNRQPVPKSFNEHLKPFLKSNL